MQGDKFNSDHECQEPLILVPIVWFSSPGFDPNHLSN